MNSTLHADVKSKRPRKDAFTAGEWALIERLNTPLKVQRYFSSLPYNREVDGASVRSFRELIKLKQAHCLESAVASAVILEQHGYAPLLLDLESKDLLDHVLFVFKSSGGGGGAGGWRRPRFPRRQPGYSLVGGVFGGFF